MLSIGWTELLIVLVVWLLLGGWRGLRLLLWQFRWMIDELRGDSPSAQQAELRLGEAMAESLTAEMPPDTDASRGKIIRNLGRRLTPAQPEPRRTFRCLFTGLLAGGGWLGHLVRRHLNRALTSAYSQDQEFEADAEAVRQLRQAGFDPRGGVRLFARLEQISGPIDQHGYFTTHPPLAARRARMQDISGQ